MNLDNVPEESRKAFAEKLASNIPLKLRMMMLKFLETGEQSLWKQIFGAL